MRLDAVTRSRFGRSRIPVRQYTTIPGSRRAGIANDYNDGLGDRNPGESVSSGDTTLSFNDTVLNAVGFYDLVVFDENNNNPFFDNGTTELKINNGQGCAQFVSPKVNFNDVRFDRCAPPGGAEPQTNTADATGEASGETFPSLDSQTIIVTATSGT